MADLDKYLQGLQDQQLQQALPQQYQPGYKVQYLPQISTGRELGISVQMPRRRDNVTWLDERVSEIVRIGREHR